MKIFWSWQSDTPGRVGRHFVRAALKEAIERLKEAPDVQEPTSAEAREDVHLDHDREGVTGSPDLARIIFEKIERSRVFVADVTLVGKSDFSPKKLINSNVGIEYGHAHKALGDQSILMVQNTYFGSRDDLPFDLKHKAGPIQYTLHPEATKPEIESELKKLTDQFVIALRPFLEKEAKQVVSPFTETPKENSAALFFKPSEILGRIGHDTVDEIQFTFDEKRTFYLRVVPTVSQQLLKHAELMDIASHNRPDILSSIKFGGILDRNRFGVIALEPSGTSTTPRSFTQLFLNREAWGVSTHCFTEFSGRTVIPVTALENTFRRVLENFCTLLTSGMGATPPFTVVFGATGLENTYLGFNVSSVEGPIFQDSFELRRTLNATDEGAREIALKDFLHELFDLAGVSLA